MPSDENCNAPEPAADFENVDELSEINCPAATCDCAVNERLLSKETDVPALFLSDTTGPSIFAEKSEKFSAARELEVSCR